MALLYGLPGFEPDAEDPSGWTKRPVILPPGRGAIEVERSG
jgi:hypothetical protein